MRFGPLQLLDLIAAADRLEDFEESLAERFGGTVDARDVVDFFDVPGGSAFDVPPANAIEFFKAKGLKPTFAWQDMLNRAHDQAFTVAKMMDVDMLGQIRASLDSALANGQSFKDWSDTITPILQAGGWWGRQQVVDPLTGNVVVAQLGSPARLETIFRTNMQSAYAAGQWQEIQAQAEVAPYLMYDAVDDDRTRPLHRLWDRTILPVESPWWRTHYPPNGWNCFPPQQAVSGRFEIGLKAPYSGPMVELTTREARTLTVTANHPVLTDRGWVAAGQLNEGDRLLTYRGEVEVTTLRGVDHKQGPMPAQDAFEALAAQGVPRAVVRTSSALDLYGDVVFGDGNIDVVGTDRVLSVGLESDSDQRVQNGHLANADALRHASVGRGGAAGELAEAALPATGSGPSLRHLPLDGGTVAADALPLDPLLLAGGSDRDAAHLQETADGITTEPAELCQARDAFSGAVAFDEVVAIRRFDWTGHVYDFQSENGLILASGIVTSNCRCGVIQMTADEIESLGLKINGEAPNNGTYTWTNPRTGAKETIPNGLDPGFANNSGMSHVAALKELLAEKMKAEQIAAKGALKEALEKQNYLINEAKAADEAAALQARQNSIAQQNRANATSAKAMADAKAAAAAQAKQWAAQQQVDLIAKGKYTGTGAGYLQNAHAKLSKSPEWQALPPAEKLQAIEDAAAALGFEP